MRILTQPLKWPGGKFYMAPKIVARMPRHLHYVEPYAGGLAVLLARDPDEPRLWLDGQKGVSEVANDINGRLVGFWRVLQCPAKFERFRRKVEAIPMARSEWEDGHAGPYADAIEDAVAFFVDCRQSRAGMMRDFTSITRSRVRRQMNGNVSEWLGAVDGLPDVHARMRRVLVENMDAVSLVKREDTPHTLHYCDPPYLTGEGEARKTANLYHHEKSRQQHAEMLDTLCQVQGKVMLSGYMSTLYVEMLKGWRLEQFDLPNNLAGGKSKGREVECLWMNYDEKGERL